MTNLFRNRLAWLFVFVFLAIGTTIFFFYDKIVKLTKQITNSSGNPITGNVSTLALKGEKGDKGDSGTTTTIATDYLKKITADYTVLATDSTKRILVVNPITLTFGDAGKYNIVVRASPVSIKNGTIAVQDLDAGDYFIEVLNGVLTIT